LGGNAFPATTPGFCSPLSDAKPFLKVTSRIVEIETGNSRSARRSPLYSIDPASRIIELMNVNFRWPSSFCHKHAYQPEKHLHLIKYFRIRAKMTLAKNCAISFSGYFGTMILWIEKVTAAKCRINQE